MATLTGKITDVTGRAPDSISSITVKAPSARIGGGTDVIVSSPATVDFNRNTGDITISGLTGGLSWLFIEGDGWSDSIPLAVAEGMITLIEAIANAAGVPGLIDFIALLTDLQNRIDGIAQDAVDGAMASHLEDINEQLNLGTGRKFLTVASVGLVDGLPPGWYTVVTGAATTLGMPTSERGVLHRSWLTPTGTAKRDTYVWDVDGEVRTYWRKFFAGAWSAWEDVNSGLSSRVEDISSRTDALETLTTPQYLIAGDAGRVNDLVPNTYTVVTGAAQYLGMPTTERGVLTRVWLNTTGSAKLDFYEWDKGGQLFRAWRKFSAGSWSAWSLVGGGAGREVIESKDDTSAAHVITDPDGHVLQEFRRDGTVLIPGLVGAGVGTGYQFVDGGLRPSETDMRRMVGWGSSTMNWLDYEFRKIAETIGAQYVNEGKGGEIGDATVARLGSRPAMVTFPSNTIPATAGEEVAVTISNVVAHGNPKPFNVMVAGVEGTLEMRGSAWYFTKVRTGNEVTVEGAVEAVPVKGEEYRGDFTILNLGKNSFNRDDIPDLVEYVYGLAVEAFDYLAPISKRALVMGHFVNAPDGPGSVRQNNVLETNARLASHFGKLYVDMQGMLESPRLWELSGLTPTSADLQAQADRTLPPSVQMDGQHLNDAGLKAVGALVREKMAELGWA